MNNKWLEKKIIPSDPRGVYKWQSCKQRTLCVGVRPDRGETIQQLEACQGDTHGIKETPTQRGSGGVMNLEQETKDNSNKRKPKQNHIDWVKAVMQRLHLK